MKLFTIDSGLNDACTRNVIKIVESDSKGFSILVMILDNLQFKKVAIINITHNK